ncbi:MAG: hypothetical protein Fur0037_10390 [Planctomycetota bacterium]
MQSPLATTAAALAVLAPLGSSQSPPYPAASGFAAETVFLETSRPLLVRGFAYDRYSGSWFEAVDNTVFRRPDPSTWLTVHSFPLPDSVGAIRAFEGNGHVLFTSLATGTVFDHDPLSGSTVSFRGVPNAFDIAIDAAGRILLAANPAWPAPGSSGGIWHVAAGIAPRQILSLSGPSGPICFDLQGNLIAAEIGTVVPPPPGAVRLLRFPAARVSAVLSGAASGLTPADADLVAPGYDGAYGLAADDAGRIHVTDAGSANVLRTAPFTLTPEPSPELSLPGFGLGIQFVSSFGDPWRRMLAYQPDDETSVLLVASSDFSSDYRVARLHPRRPRLSGPTAAAAGPLLLRCSGAPANSLVLFGLSLPRTIPESVVAFADGTPLWLGLDAGTASVPLYAVADASGSAAVTLRNPGGVPASLFAQALALGPSGSGAHGTSSVLAFSLLP